MIENDEKYFTLLGDNGEEALCKTLFTFDCTETNKSYIVYTDNEVDTDGNTIVYASVLNPIDEFDSELLPIETEREWAIINTILDGLKKNADDE